MQWIANLFRPKRKDRLDVIETFQHELDGVTLIVTVEDFHLGEDVNRRVALDAYFDGDGDYYPVAVFPEDHVEATIALLIRAQEFMHSTKGVRRLPTVCMCKTQYFVDVRLRELRNVNDPNHRVPFDEE
ncbi:MAG TPA: hypothetical protein VHR66_01855 [Gemmataceae bacterium]|jgi:hypothetical protein|nr:hypothetical protein [Gemmataceae bacterium]